jgi:hypothetical protein
MVAIAALALAFGLPAISAIVAQAVGGQNFNPENIIAAWACANYHRLSVCKTRWSTRHYTQRVVSEG